eukprot:GHVU01079942.1.p1 GENE.GHVU01079942.1~~GHVU01079942.1.p1  ORF type:complete len:129 (+),score=25.27 GHVU01079942.1:83-469(+)
MPQKQQQKHKQKKKQLLERRTEVPSEGRLTRRPALLLLPEEDAEDEPTNHAAAAAAADKATTDADSVVHVSTAALLNYTRAYVRSIHISPYLHGAVGMNVPPFIHTAAAILHTHTLHQHNYLVVLYLL